MKPWMKLSVHEAEGPGMSKDEYLHEGGWQNVDNSLGELEFVRCTAFI